MQKSIIFKFTNSREIIIAKAIKVEAAVFRKAYNPVVNELHLSMTKLIIFFELLFVYSMYVNERFLLKTK